MSAASMGRVVCNRPALPEDIHLELYFVRAILPGARRARTPGRQPRDVAVTPALIVHGILAFTALAFISYGVFGRV
jgi:hypothetical protein